MLSLDRPERKNPLTFESYAELRDWFARAGLRRRCEGGRLRIERRKLLLRRRRARHHRPLLQKDMKGLLAFTRMTGDLVKAIIACGKPVIAAVDGACVGAGAIIAMAADLRLATPEAKTAFLFTRVGLAGCDMGACAILPRIIGQGREAELLFTGRSMSATEGERWGFFNRLVAAAELESEAVALARRLSEGPGFAHMMTKTMLAQEWSMGIEQALEAEAQAQALCMQTQDSRRAYEAFVAKQKPAFEGD